MAPSTTRHWILSKKMPSGRWSEIVDALIQGYRDGKLRTSQEGTTFVDTLFEDVPQTWMRLFEGGEYWEVVDSTGLAFIRSVFAEDCVNFERHGLMNLPVDIP